MTKKVLLFAAILTFASCQDDAEFLQVEQSQSVESRAIYDSGYVEWDNVSGLSYKAGSDEIKQLSIPWEAGNSHNTGIPASWYDYNLRDSNPSNRYYSQVNGWRLVYCNLLDSSQTNKYFVLYNRYTGIIRAFFYAIDSYAGDGTTSTFVGLHVKGASSLLNFSFDMPLAMNQVQTNASTFFSPTWSVTNGVSNNNVGYHGNQWFGIEAECAYDSQALNTLVMNIYGSNVAMTTTSGSSTGTMSGNIQTTYSNNPNYTLNFTSNSTETHNVSSTLNLSYNDSGAKLGEKIETEVKKENSFFKDLWNGLKEDLPELATKGIKDGISSIFSAGGSIATKAIGKLAQSIFGVSSAPTSSTSKVDLGINLTMTSESKTEIQKDAWGIQGIPLPGGTEPNALFNEKLGVWNIDQTPTFYMDMHAYSYFWPWDLAPDQTKPRAFEIEFKYHFSPSTLVVNPSLLNEFEIKNLQQEPVFTSNLKAYVKNTTKAYGLNGDTQIYQSLDNPICIEGIAADYTGSSYNPNTSYSSKWALGTQYLNNEYFLCRVSFDLVSKTDGKTLSYSKYFIARGVQRNYYHEERIIDENTDIEITSLIPEEEMQLMTSSHSKY